MHRASAIVVSFLGFSALPLGGATALVLASSCGSPGGSVSSSSSGGGTGGASSTATASSSSGGGAGGASSATTSSSSGGGTGGMTTVSSSSSSSGSCGGGSLRAIAITAGDFHSCALLSDGSARCWGENDEGQLGNGTSAGPSMCVNNGVAVACSTTPSTVSGLTCASSISAGGFQTCAVRADGTVACWGYNGYGELGDGTSTGPTTCGSNLPCATTPVQVSNLKGVTAISASDEEHACALLGGGTIACWGLNSGQFGDGTTTGPSTCTIGGASYDCATTPFTVPNLKGATAVATSTFHTCALFPGGSVECWGSNLDGRIGDGTTVDALVPAAVSNLSGATAIATGASHTCALVAGGAVECWGSNGAAQLGVGTTGLSTCNVANFNFPCATTPVPVSNLTGATAIATGGVHSCALLGDGTVMCWGRNDVGQLGNGTTTGPSTCMYGAFSYACATTPVPVSNLTGVTAISAGGTHTCALVKDGSVWCWGDNTFGWLGDGTTTGSSTPVMVTW